MVDPFGEISFLTRSENRVVVLGSLAEAGRTEYELVEETGISDVTVGRILEDFSERGWIREEDGVYRTTAVGELIADDYQRLEDSMDLAARLGPVLELLPTEEMEFDLRLLADGRVSDPETFAPLRAVDRWKQLLRQADRVVGTAPAAAATTVVAEPFHEQVVEHGMEFRVVVSHPYYERARRRPEICRLLREQFDAGMEMYLAADADEFTVQVAAFDDIATLSAYDDAGNLKLGIETRARPVHEWVVETFESHRSDATPLSAADFEA